MSLNLDSAVLQWERAGLPCVAITLRTWINGYVQLPADHVGRNSGYETLNRVVSVHGGLTYGVDEDGWVGFDTAHGGDYWPPLPGSDPIGPERAWDLPKLVAETNALADQLAALTEITDPTDPWSCTDEEFARILRESRAWRRLRASREAVSR